LKGGAVKSDVLALAELRHRRKESRDTEKHPSKETLNHPDLINLASGLNCYTNTPEAYLEAYRSLGIDLINRVPEENVPAPLACGEVREAGGGYKEAYLGLFSTVARHVYPFSSVEEFWAAPSLDPKYEQLRTPVPHRLDAGEIRRKNELLGEVGLYYYMLYTTLFMWAVECLGWEVFLIAAAMDPDGFDEKFLQVVFPKSLEMIDTLAQVDSPFVFCHDDLVDSKGPMFRPRWYEKYIFPRYEQLWKPVKQRGKQIIFVADGNMSEFLLPLRQTGVDGVMLENPATDFDRILDVFSDKIVIGGIETGVLMHGSVEQVRKHVLEVQQRTLGIPGFVMSTPGGIHGNLPLENLIAYFDARVQTGHTPEGWQKRRQGG
jgi:hypothetical protein